MVGSTHQKYVNALFLVGAALVWFVSQHYFEVLVGTYQLNRKLGWSTDLLLHGLPVALGVLAFYLLRTNALAYNFVSDSIGELVKVSWPGKKETQLGTVVVIVAVLAAGVFFAFVDWIFTSALKGFLGA
jgi:preprotein translocase subunit SecE